MLSNAMVIEGQRKSPIIIVMIGFGYWGPNLVRNVVSNPRFKLVGIADIDKDNRARAKLMYPDISIVSDSDQLIKQLNVEAIVVATPASTHYRLCVDAIASGKHVLVTKPITCSQKETKKLAILADKKNKVLLVDHTFLYSPAIVSIKEIIDNNLLGDLLYFESVRSGLGIYKDDVNVVDDLTIHDLAIIEHLFSGMPKSVSCITHSNFSGLKEDVAYVTLNYDSGFIAHISSHWFSPIKQRKIVIAGNKKMLVWDDTLLEGSVKIYDTGVDFCNVSSVSGRAPISYRNNGAKEVSVKNSEPLANEVDDFANCILQKKKPISHAESAVRVAEMIDAIHCSAKKMRESESIF